MIPFTFMIFRREKRIIEIATVCLFLYIYILVLHHCRQRSEMIDTTYVWRSSLKVEYF